jgi:hypothetical protein
MARVTTFSSVPNVQGQGVTDARVHSADFGKAQVGAGITKLGAGLAQAGDTLDEIGTLQARTEASRLLVEHTKLTGQIAQRVREAQGENALPAAQQGMADLTAGTSDILNRASPRAKEILQNELAARNVSTEDNWHTYGFEQHKVAYKANTDAANKTDLEAAIAEPDEQKGAIYLDSIRQRTEQAGQFFGLGSDEIKANVSQVASTYFKQRALNTAAAGDPIAALRYADEHHKDMSPGDYADVQRSYRDEAIKQRGFLIASGQPDPGGVELDTSKPVPANDQQPTSDGQPAHVATADPAAVWSSVIIPNEGRARVTDVNGYPVQYGINGKFHPEVNQPGFNEAKAYSIFKAEYWDESGADKMPPALAALHADTYYLNKKAAKRIQRESGGDFDTYMNLRKEWMAQMESSNPSKFGGNVAKSYEQRNDNIVKYASMTGIAPFSFSGRIAPHSDMTRVRDEVMGRKDIPLDLKMSIIDAASKIRGDLKAEQSNREDLAHDNAIRAATQLGEGFTSITQLPANVVASLSPDDLHSLTTLAKNNNEGKVAKDLDPTVTDKMVTDPKGFTDPKYINELIAKGATPDYIAKVREKQSEVRGQIISKVANANPDPLSSGELWTVAKPVADHLGLQLDGVKDVRTGKKLNSDEINAITERRYKFTTYLRERADEWAAQNPGKKPPEEEVRKWVAGGATRIVGNGDTRLFEANDYYLYSKTPTVRRQAILREYFMRTGKRPSPSEAVNIVANFQRRDFAYGHVSGQ